MKRMFAALLAALAVMGMGEALAQPEIRVYAAQGSLTKAKAAQLVQLLEREFDGAAFSVTMEEAEGTTLRELVLADRAPQIALCTPQEAAIWAQEGLLLDIKVSEKEEARMAGAVLAACRQGDMLFMAPLVAKHRQMAVNRALFEDMELEPMLSFRDYPVWLPMQMLQVLDEFTLAGVTAMELWPVTEETCAAVLALAQSLYCGLFVSEDGEQLMMDSDAVHAGASWIEDMVDAGLIGVANSREEALARFLAGKTAVFPDWTDAEAKRLSAQGGKAIEVVAVPYPASSGLTVRAFDLVGAAVFASGDAKTDGLSEAVISFLMEDAQAQQVLGERAIWADGAQWMVPLGTNAKTVLLRSALCKTLDAMLSGKMAAGTAMEAAAAAMSLHSAP